MFLSGRGGNTWQLWWDCGRVWPIIREDTEKIDKKIGRGLNRALELRNKARYDFKIQISEEQTKGVIELAGKLKEFLSERVRKWKKL